MEHAVSYQDIFDPSCDEAERAERFIAAAEEIARERASDFFDLADINVMASVFDNPEIESALAVAIRTGMKGDALGLTIRKAIEAAREAYCDSQWEFIAEFRYRRDRWPTYWPQGVQ